MLLGQLNEKWWPYITKRPQGQFARTFYQQWNILGASTKLTLRPVDYIKATSLCT